MCRFRTFVLTSVRNETDDFSWTNCVTGLYSPSAIQAMWSASFDIFPLSVWRRSWWWYGLPRPRNYRTYIVFAAYTWSPRYQIRSSLICFSVRGTAMECSNGQHNRSRWCPRKAAPYYGLLYIALNPSIATIGCAIKPFQLRPEPSLLQMVGFTCTIMSHPKKKAVTSWNLAGVWSERFGFRIVCSS